MQPPSKYSVLKVDSIVTRSRTRILSDLLSIFSLVCSLSSGESDSQMKTESGSPMLSALPYIYPQKVLWEALFLCHQLFRAVSGEVAERLHYAYPEYDRNITKYTRDMYKKYTGKTGCLDSTYAADIEERREQ